MTLKVMALSTRNMQKVSKGSTISFSESRYSRFALCNVKLVGSCLLFPRPRMNQENGVIVQFYSVPITIYDIDAALGYIFSACPLPPHATPSDNFLPLLALYCKFMSLVDTGTNDDPPTIACVAIGLPPGSGNVEAITFGATIRGRAKDKWQKLRLELLKTAFNQSSDFQTCGLRQLYGHCAETYPFICYMDRYVSRSPKPQPSFTGPVRGMAVKVEAVARKNFSPFAYEESVDHKRACMNCENLLTKGGRPPYNCFPQRLQ